MAQPLFFYDGVFTPQIVLSLVNSKKQLPLIFIDKPYQPATLSASNWYAVCKISLASISAAL